MSVAPEGRHATSAREWGQNRSHGAPDVTHPDVSWDRTRPAPIPASPPRSSGRLCRPGRVPRPNHPVPPARRHHPARSLDSKRDLVPTGPRHRGGSVSEMTMPPDTAASAIAAPGALPGMHLWPQGSLRGASTHEGIVPAVGRPRGAGAVDAGGCPGHAGRSRAVSGRADRSARRSNRLCAGTDMAALAFHVPVVRHTSTEWHPHRGEATVPLRIGVGRRR